MCFRCWEKGGAGRALCGTAGFGEGTTELDREQGERVTLGRRREPGFPCGSGLSREPLAPPPAAQELAAEAAPTSDRGRCTRGRLLDSGDVFSTDCPHAHALSRDRTLRHRQARSRSEEHTSELQSLMRISYAVLCFNKQKRKSKQQKRKHN